MKSKHTGGDDCIPASIMKHSLLAIKEVVVFIINNSMRFSPFYAQLKSSTRNLIYKNQENTESFENQRSLSLLPTVSKLFEI